MPRLSLSACLLVCALAGPVFAAPPFAADERAAVAGEPTAIEIAPGSVTLTGTHDARQLVITGKYADGTVRDLTALATVVVKPGGIVEVQEGGYLRPRQNGSATLVASVGGKQASVPVTVTGMEMPVPGQLPPRRDRRAERRRLQRRRLPRHPERQERLQALAPRLRPARRLTSSSPATSSAAAPASTIRSRA